VIHLNDPNVQVAAAGESLLRVWFGEFIDDDRCKSESLELPSPEPEYFSKGVAHSRYPGGGNQPAAVIREVVHERL
jgi:hypothetical protein